ncbi:MAG: hypothetical protein AAFV43_02990 [Planctomycetota bacterium]
MPDLPTIYLYSAIGGGVVLAIQLGMMLLGMDDTFAEGGDTGFDFSDADADGGNESSGLWLLEMISLRTVSAAATLFGIVGWSAMSAGQSAGASLAFAGLAGYAALYFVYWLFKQVFRLEASGNANIQNAVGLPAQVYVPIGPGDAAGKVTLKMQGRTMEYQALTSAASRLATGEQVVVTEVVSSDTLRVAPASTS